MLYITEQLLSLYRYVTMLSHYLARFVKNLEKWGLQDVIFMAIYISGSLRLSFCDWLTSAMLRDMSVFLMIIDFVLWCLIVACTI